MARFKGTDDDDRFTGSAGDDVAFGGAGFDILSGGDGDDRLLGEDGDDWLFGDAGNDILFGGEGIDELRGGDGDDILFGGGGYDWILAGDTLIGGAGDDLLNGGAGDDVLLGGAGIDRYVGGAGHDGVNFYDPAATEGVAVNLQSGIVANDGFGNRERMTGVEAIYGGLFADYLRGSDRADMISGSQGDILLGLGGNDMIRVGSVEKARVDGGDGIDTIVLFGVRSTRGEDGTVAHAYADQSMVVDLAAGRVENDGFGYSARISGFENASTVDGNDRLIGSDGRNTLYGGGGEDVIDGGRGNDIIVGGLGSDTLTGGAGKDVFAWGMFQEYLGETDNWAVDTITDFGAGDRLDLRPGQIALSFIGTAAFGNERAAIRYEIVDGDTWVYARSHLVTGDIDVTVKLLGIHELTADDFVMLRASPPAPAIPAEFFA